MKPVNMMDSIQNFRIKQMSPQLQVADVERSIESSICKTTRLLSK